MGDCLGTWSWLGDPHPDAPRLAERALAAERRPRLTYGPTVWRLVHDAAAADAAEPALSGYCLHLVSHFSTLVGVVGAPLHLAREAQLRRAVEPLFAPASTAAETEDSVEALLDAAGVAIDGVLG